jgi:multidrug resistance efflux pump
MNWAWIAAVLTTFGQVAAEAPSPGEALGDPTFEHAAISAQLDVQIAAQVEGVLLQLPVREGTPIAADQVLATIDDRQAQAAVDVADIGVKAATAKAEDKIEEEYAKAAAKVAEADLRKDLEVNQRSPGTVSETEIQKKKLDLIRSRLQIEKAKKDQVLARLEADVKEAELKAAKVALERRTIKAPFEGEVQTLFQKEAQWVNPGDPILRLVRLDVLDVECYVKAQDFDPVDLANRPVTVVAHLARGRKASIEGRVVYINQSVLRGIYMVRAEIQNQKVGDYWVVRPGLDAEVTIHISRPPLEAKAAAALP